MFRLPPLAAVLITGALMVAAPVRAQSGEVVGSVADSAGVDLPGATVLMLQPADSALVGFGTTGSDGAFRLPRVPRGRYLLRVTFVGMTTHTDTLDVAGARVDVGRVVLRPESAELGELVVTSDRVPVILRGDTLDFDASAFGAGLGDTVEDLLRRMPGIDVDRDGSVTAQGEEVSQVLVDGKEFFGGDPTVATRNLPADAVDRVQVFDKQSESAEFTGVDDGQEERTINLALKEDRKSGAFGNVAGGLGGGVETGSDVRYDGKATLNRFSGTTQAALLANVNNVNRQSFGFRDYLQFMGGMARMGRGGSFTIGGDGDIPFGDDASSGFATTWSAGLNLSHDFAGGTEVRSSYFGSRLETLRATATDGRQLLDSALPADLDGRDTDDETVQSHRATLDVFHPLGEGHDVRLNAGGSLGTTSLVGQDFEATRLAQTGILQTERTLVTDGSGDGLEGNAALTYRMRLGGKRSLVATLGGSARDAHDEQRLASTSLFYEQGALLTTEEIDQLQTQQSDGRSWRAEALLTQPLGRGYALQFEAERRAEFEHQDRRALVGLGQAERVDPRQTSAFEQTTRYATAGVTARRNREAVRLSASLEVQHVDLDGQTARADAVVNAAPVGFSSVRLLPSARASFEFENRPRLWLTYNTSTREPTARQLQPVADVRSPQFTSLGNPDLRPEYTHSLTARVLHFDSFAFTNLFAFARASYTPTAITTARTVGEGLREVTRPENVGAAWTLQGNLTYGRPLRPIGAKVSVGADALLRRTTELLNRADNEVDLLRYGASLSLENRRKETLDVEAGARFSWSRTTYALRPAFDQDYLTRSFFARGLVTVGAFEFETDVDYALFPSALSGQRRALPRWNATAIWQAMPKMRVELAAVDLLDQGLAVDFTETGTLVREERTESLGRYVLLRLVYDVGRGGGGGGPFGR